MLSWFRRGELLQGWTEHRFLDTPANSIKSSLEQLTNTYAGVTLEIDSKVTCLLSSGTRRA